jgi:Methyltransferase FkbM domain
MSNFFFQAAWYLLCHRSFLKAGRDRLFFPDLHADWQSRIKLTSTCPDNIHIPRVPEAGEIVNEYLIMHNGLRVGMDSYYGEENAKLIHANRGVHEPQEEYAFQEVLKYVPPDATMLELGAYWGFYSLWFTQAVAGGRAYLVEPEKLNLQLGIQNFQMNGRQGDFTRALIDQTTNWSSIPPQICVDDFVRDKGIDHVTILHSDIQGYELHMLQGAQRLFRERKVDYVFISTHGFWLHLLCLGFLKRNHFKILATADKFESFSLDGLIVARRDELPGCPRIQISLR